MDKDAFHYGSRRGSPQFAQPSLWLPTKGLEGRDMGRRRDRRLTAGIFLPLLLLCLFARGAVPAGWMPAFTDQGVSLILCSGMAEPPSTQGEHSGHNAHADHHQSGSSHDHSGKSKHDMAGQPCAFAAAAADLPSPDLSVVPAGLVSSDLPFQRSTAVTVGRGLAAPPPPATGPPITA